MPSVEAPILVADPQFTTQQQSPNTLYKEGDIECMKLLKSPVKGAAVSGDRSLSPNISQTPVKGPQASDMNTTSDRLMSQGHPIDNLPAAPVSPNHHIQHPIPEASLPSSEFGPYVSGLPVPEEDFRRRSSSFTSQRDRQARPMHRPVHNVVDPLRRFSESQFMTRTGSAENVIAHPANINRLRHSQTISEIPPHALSNDSGYITPPNNNRQHNSPPWPPNSAAGIPPQWPLNLSPSNTSNIGAAAAAADSRNRSSAPLPLSQHLTIETGHYQPEPSTPPQIVVAPSYHSMQPMHYNSPGQGYARQRDPYSSLQSQSSGSTGVPTTPQTPEEGVLMYQRERKTRLVTAFQKEEQQLLQLKNEEQDLLRLIATERNSESNPHDTTGIVVQTMEAENQNLKLEIQRLVQLIPSNPPPASPPTPARPIYSPQHPPVTTTPPLVVVPGTPITQSRPTSGTGHGTPPPPYPVQTPPYPVQTPPYPVQVYNPPNTNPGGSPIAGRRPIPAPRPTEEIPDTVKWACVQCTYLNHPLIRSCEICEAPRPNVPGCY